MNFNFAAFLLAATASFGANAENAAPTNNNLRGQQRQLQTSSFNEGLGRCGGAVCSMWGDPHLVTCDGLAYDCQGVGIYTLMENQMFNIQANFVDVGDREHVMVEGWGLTHGASITNDIMVEYKQNDDVPILQFGFGDLSGFEETPPSEEGCETWTTFRPVDMGGALDGGRTCEATLEDCRARCDANPDCTQFSWWADCGCHLNNDDAVMEPSNPHWPRALAGTTDSSCGLPIEEEISLVGSNGEEELHGEISQQCPLLMYVDGELQDLSHLNPGAATQVLYGDYDGDVYVELRSNNDVVVNYKTSDAGDYATMELRRTGDGPGELWSCHWNYYICLPQSQQDQFEQTTVGLLGTPNGDQQDDWMTRDGTTLPLQHTGANRHGDMHEYCVDNWCVPQEDSIMTYHGDTTYADHKCEKEDHIDWHEDDHCVLSGDQIFLACRDQPPHTRYACELDCCLGGCGTIEEVTEDVIQIVRHEEEPPSTNFEYDGDEACVKDDLEDTSSTVCPDNTDLVKLLKTTGDTPLPEEDIFYDISFGEDDTVSFKINNPFGASSNVFVKHDRQAMNNFLDPVCEGEELRPVDCNNDFELTVACLDYPDIEPFALVSVYFASVAVSPLNEQATIDRCCEPDEYAPAVGIVEYTFEIPCGCPGADVQ